ncbi:FUSC family protein [Pseudomonas sp. ABC1]|uniref:FUSC family protein n=1 Tax=Pseudomonas sp. ABC1 TaxID=2748080 RepID=UPI0015C38F13|nr:FUSC family protein [Pseudomonas sp. ABC1]QLF92780.1 FUSC family protein [Pseudomonas sp. ABC1]
MNASLATLRSACLEWARIDGVNWVYILKVLTAAFLTLWLAMRLELPSPSTACVTVFIVMQPQSGQVFAKSFYRLIGSCIGLSVMLVLIALFAQERVLFLLCAALWIGLCTAGAARFRDFRAYACVLAGYSATLIGLPATTHPEDAFMQAVWRLLEISLAVGCTALVSALLFPRSTAAAMRNALYVRFGAFAGFMLDCLGRQLDREALERHNLRFVSEAVGLEAMRSASVFEDPHMRMRNRRLARMNSEFMSLTTRFHAFSQLLERLREQGREALLEQIRHCAKPFIALLGPLRDKPLTPEGASALAVELERMSERLRQDIREVRSELGDMPPEALLDFNSCVELLFRLLDDLHAYALTHASLGSHRHEREQWQETFRTNVNGLAALVAGVRAGLVILAFGSFWIASAWPSGGIFSLNAVAVMALISSSPAPARTAWQMALGTAFASVAGVIIGLFVLPQIDGFVLLCVVIAPVLALGALLSIRPAWAGYGLGILVFFSLGSIPANHTEFDPAGLINNYIALVLSMSIVSAISAVLLPPNSPWMWRRLEGDLRRRMTYAVSAPMHNLATGFESATRDILMQAYGLSVRDPGVQRQLLRWTFLVLEIGRAVIELRREQERLTQAPWQPGIRALGRALIRLFEKPDAGNRLRALASVQQAIDLAQQDVEAEAIPFDQAPVRRTLSYLHFIRSSLLEPQSPLPPMEARHAA